MKSTEENVIAGKMDTEREKKFAREREFWVCFSENYSLYRLERRDAANKKDKSKHHSYDCVHVWMHNSSSESQPKKWEIIFLYLHRLFRSLFAVTLHCDQNQRNDGNRNWAINNNESWNFFKHKKWSKLQTNFSFTNHISWE